MLQRLVNLYILSAIKYVHNQRILQNFAYISRKIAKSADCTYCTYFIIFKSYKKLFYFLILSCNKDFDLLKIFKSYNTNDITDANIYIKENGEIALYNIQTEMNKLTYSTIFKIK